MTTHSARAVPPPSEIMRLGERQRAQALDLHGLMQEIIRIGPAWLTVNGYASPVRPMLRLSVEGEPADVHVVVGTEWFWWLYPRRMIAPINDRERAAQEIVATLTRVRERQRRPDGRWRA